MSLHIAMRRRMPEISSSSEQPHFTSAAISAESIPVPQSFQCPITQDLMRDPVCTVDGQVYERAAIMEWFRRGHYTSPLTGMILPSLALVDEYPLRRAIEEYLASRPALVHRELDRLALEEAAAALEADLFSKRRILEERERDDDKRDQEVSILKEEVKAAQRDKDQKDEELSLLKEEVKVAQREKESFLEGLDVLNQRLSFLTAEMKAARRDQVHKDRELSRLSERAQSAQRMLEAKDAVIKDLTIKLRFEQVLLPVFPEPIADEALYEGNYGPEVLSFEGNYGPEVPC